MGLFSSLRLIVALLPLALASVQSDANVARRNQNCLADIIIDSKIDRRDLLVRREGSSEEWSYEGETGPTYWGTLPNSSKCSTGQYQSPINFVGTKLLKNSRPTPNWSDPKNATFKMVPFVNDGLTVQLWYSKSNLGMAAKTKQMNGKTYNLIREHFHVTSEHHVDDKFYPLEAHFVHQADDKSLSVIGVFFEIGQTENAHLKSFLSKIPEKPEIEGTTTGKYVENMNLQSVADHFKKSKFFQYSGSLTTPPCSEGIYWTVAQTPMNMTLAQWNKFREVMPFSARPSMPNHSA